MDAQNCSVLLGVVSRIQFYLAWLRCWAQAEWRRLDSAHISISSLFALFRRVEHSVLDIRQDLATASQRLEAAELGTRWTEGDLVLLRQQVQDLAVHVHRLQYLFGLVFLVFAFQLIRVSADRF